MDLSGRSLRSLREDANLTQAELAAGLARLSGETCGPDADGRAPTAGMVSKWETDAKRPSARYRRLLGALLAEQLAASRDAARPAGSYHDETSGPRATGAGTDRTEPDTDRRTFLGGLVVLPGGCAEEAVRERLRLARALTADGRADALAKLADRIEREYEHRPPEAFSAGLAAAEVGLGEVLRDGARGADRARVLHAGGRLATLRANVEFNLGREPVARLALVEAHGLAALSQDRDLQGWAWVNQAMVELYSRRPAAALSAAEQGVAVLGGGPLAAYLHNYRARALARLADAAGARRAVADSYKVMNSLGPQEQGSPGFSRTTYHPLDLASETVTVMAALGEARQALDLAARVRVGVDSAGLSGLRAQARFSEAHALLLARKPEKAAELVRQAHDLTAARRPWWFEVHAAQFRAAAWAARSGNS